MPSSMKSFQYFVRMESIAQNYPTRSLDFDPSEFSLAAGLVL